MREEGGGQKSVAAQLAKLTRQGDEGNSLVLEHEPPLHRVHPRVSSEGRADERGRRSLAAGLKRAREGGALAEQSPRRGRPGWPLATCEGGAGWPAAGVRSGSRIRTEGARKGRETAALAGRRRRRPARVPGSARTRGPEGGERMCGFGRETPHGKGGPEIQLQRIQGEASAAAVAVARVGRRRRRRRQGERERRGCEIDGHGRQRTS